MTVKKLIDRLNKYPEDTKILSAHLLAEVDEALLDIVTNSVGRITSIDELDKWTEKLAYKHGWRHHWLSPEEWEDPIGIQCLKELDDIHYDVRTWDGSTIYASRDDGYLSKIDATFLQAITDPAKYI